MELFVTSNFWGGGSQYFSRAHLSLWLQRYTCAYSRWDVWRSLARPPHPRPHPCPLCASSSARHWDGESERLVLDLETLLADSLFVIWFANQKLHLFIECWEGCTCLYSQNLCEPKAEEGLGIWGQPGLKLVPGSLGLHGKAVPQWKPRAYTMVFRIFLERRSHYTV